MPVTAFQETSKRLYMHLQALHNINHVEQTEKINKYINSNEINNNL